MPELAPDKKQSVTGQSPVDAGGAGTSGTVRLVHLTDIHLSPLPPFPWRHWNLKRVLGYFNWKGKRQFVHSRDAVDALVEHIGIRPHDHILVGGDLVNIALPLEYAQALRWLLSVGDASEVMVVPGNHDIYCRLLTDPGIARWQAYMTGDARWDAPGADRTVGPTFPYVRTIGRVAVIGINTAKPTPPGVASGRMGERQQARLSSILRRTGEQGLFRLVLMHHPPRPEQAAPSRGLRDGAQLIDVIAEAGAEAILHGHNHRLMEAEAETPNGTCPIWGAGSASAEVAFEDEGLAGYQELEITGDGPGNWAVTCRRFGLDADDETDEIAVKLLQTLQARPGASADLQTAGTAAMTRSGSRARDQV